MPKGVRGFQKGKPKTGGIQKGKEHTTTLKAKELILSAIDSQSVHFDSVMAKLKTSDPKEWANIMTKLMAFVMPKYVDVSSGGEKLTDTRQIIIMQPDANKGSGK